MLPFPACLEADFGLAGDTLHLIQITAMSA
jgi:hypothetical protein